MLLRQLRRLLLPALIGLRPRTARTRSGTGLPGGRPADPRLPTRAYAAAALRLLARLGADGHGGNSRGGQEPVRLGLGESWISPDSSGPEATPKPENRGGRPDITRRPGDG